MKTTISIEAHTDGAAIVVWVVPGANSTEIVGEHDGALRVRVAAPPEGGKANAAVASLLRQALGARDAYLEGGARSRRKTFVLVGLTPDAVRKRLHASG
jgi:uncharacterized protein (TIGR00251 family)